MITRVYSVYDSKAENFMSPFYQQTDGQAIRAFSDVCNDPDHPFARHPGDYTLFHISTYDSNIGLHANLKTPLSLGLAITFIDTDEQPELPLLKEVTT